VKLRRDREKKQNYGRFVFTGNEENELGPFLHGEWGKKEKKTGREHAPSEQRKGRHAQKVFQTAEIQGKTA